MDYRTVGGLRVPVEEQMGQLWTELRDLRNLVNGTNEFLGSVEDRLSKIEEELNYDLFTSPEHPENAMWICRFCGTVMGWETRICSNCGESRP